MRGALAGIARPLGLAMLVLLAVVVSPPEAAAQTCSPQDICCGNRICDPGEDPASCPEDCRGCGDGICEAQRSENSVTCPADCPARCGDGVCDGGAGENGSTCPADCGGCVPLPCEGSCGIVDDGCGGTLDCGPCGQCGNGIPETGEDCSNCPGDVAFTPAFSASTSQARVGDAIVFTADESRIVPGSVPLWDLGDTQHRSGNPLSYSYSAPGVFSARLTITESNCGTTQVSAPRAVEILPPVCGNGRCDPGEDEASCSEDCAGCVPSGCAGRCGPVDNGCGSVIDCGPCGGTCGNGVVDPGEDCASCPSDVALKPAFTVSQTSALVGEPITFAAQPDLILDPPTPLWDLGDTTHLSGTPLVYSYAAPGSYDVVLTASESRCGLTRLSDPQRILVTDTPGPRFTASAGGPYSGEVGSPVSFLAVVTTNAGEAVTRYAWSFGDGTSAEGLSPSHAYEVAGSYVVGLTVTTDTGLTESAETTAAIQPAASLPPQTSISFLYDPTSDALLFSASISVPCPVECSRYDAYLQAGFFDPDVNLVHVTGYLKFPSNGTVTLPVPPPLQRPRPGIWGVLAQFWYLDKFLGFPAFFEVDEKFASAVVPPKISCGGPGQPPCIDISPQTATIDDGGRLDYTASVAAPSLPASWSSTTPPGSEAQSVDFQPVSVLSATAQGHWFANPAGDQSRCVSTSQLQDMAFTSPKYTIRAAATLADGRAATGQADLTVQMPWGLDEALGGRRAGETRSPNIQGEVFINAGCSDTPVPGSCFITRHTLQRTDPAVVLFIPAASRFHDKVEVHENEHVQQYGPGRVWGDISTVAGLLAFPHPVSGVAYIDLRADTRTALRQMIDETRAAYRAAQLALLEDPERKRQAECEAYAVSDPVEPRYLIQGCNTPHRCGQ